MKYMIVSCFTIFSLIIGIIKPIAAQNDIWQSWDNSKSAVPSNLQQNIANIVAGKLNNESPKTSVEDRQEAAQRESIINDLRGASDLLYYLDNPDYCDMIFISEFRQKLIRNLNNSERLLDYYKNNNRIREVILSNDMLLRKLKHNMLNSGKGILDLMKYSDLKNIILSDSDLKQLYMKYDIMEHPDKIEEYTKSSDFKSLIKDDPELRKEVSDIIADKIIAEKEAMEKKRIAEQEEADRRRRAWEAEQRRLKEEYARAQIQLEQNKQERQRDVELSQQIATPICPRDDRGQNKVGGVIVEQVEYDELFEDPAVSKAKRNSIVYATQDRLEKAFEDASVMAKIELKKKQKEWQGKVVAIPIGKADAFMNNTLEMAYPGSELWKKVKVSQAVRHDEENLITNVVKCVAEESVEAVSSGDFKRFNECITQAKDAFLDKMGEHIADLTHTQNYRKIYKWFTKKEKNDEDY